MNINKTHLLFSFLLFLFLTACGDDEMNTPNNSNQFLEGDPGTVTGEVDGSSFASGGIYVDAELNIDDYSMEYDLRIDAEQEKDGFDEDFDLNLFGVDFSTLKEGDVFVGDSDNSQSDFRIFTANYSKISRTAGSNVDIQTATLFVSSSICTITKIDKVNQLVSGTFSFDAVDIFDNTTTYQVRNGVFTDVKYSL